MSSRSQTIARSGWITGIGAIAALVVTGGTTSIEAATPDYHLNLKVPPQFVGCKDKTWFDSRLALIRGEERFPSVTDIDVTVTEDEGAGWALKVALRSGVDGAEIASKQASYAQPIECTQVVADAAEIVVQMMHKRDPTPQTAPAAHDYEVVLDAPESLAACRNTDQWRKFFEFARGDARFLAPYRKRVELKFEGDLAAEIVVWITVRGRDGYPILGPEGKPLDKVRRPYAKPLECTRALAYAAHSVTNLIRQPKLSPRPLERILPTPERSPSFAFSVINYTNIFYKNLGFGAQMMLELPVRSQFSFRVAASALYPLAVTLKSEPRKELLYNYDASTMGVVGLDLCYGRYIFRTCARGNMGIVQLIGVGSSITRTPAVAYLSIGPNVSMAFPALRPGEYGKFQLQLDGGYYINVVRPQAVGKTIDPRLGVPSRVLDRPTFISGSVAVGVRYTF